MKPIRCKINVSIGLKYLNEVIVQLFNRTYASDVDSIDRNNCYVPGT